MHFHERSEVVWFSLPTGGIQTHRPLKGKRLTTFCASLKLLQNVFAVHRRAIPLPSAAESGCRPLSEANTTLLHNLRRKPRPFPSEPARSAGGTHRSVRQHMTDRTRAPKAPEPGRLWRALLLFPSKTTTLKTENIERKCFLWIPPARRRGCFPIRLL